MRGGDRPHRPVLGRRRHPERRGEPDARWRGCVTSAARRRGSGSPSCSSSSTWSRRRSKPLATYSGGMKRRLDLAMTLVAAPRIIFLDEPTTGLDPRSRHTMWEIIRELVAKGTTIFLTTQYLDEADELADRIAVLDNGRIVAEGTPDELKRLVPGGHIRLRFADAAGARRRPRACSTDRRPTTTRSPSRCRATGESARCVGARPPRHGAASRSTTSPSTPPTSTTCSSRSRAQTRREPNHDHRSPLAEHPPAVARRRRRDHDAAPQPAAHGALPRPVDVHHPRARSSSCCCSSSSSAARSAPACPASSRPAAGTAYLAYVVPGILLITIAGTRQRRRDHRRHGHDRGHHRPVPHDGDLPRRRCSPGT